jgi:hypothetical protein
MSNKKSRLQEKIEIRGVSQCISEMDFPNYDELGKLLKHVGYRLVEMDSEQGRLFEDEVQPKNLKNY